MIQILGLRSWTPRGEDKPKTYDAFHDKNWRAKSIPELFKNIDKHLAAIPEKESWDLCVRKQAWCALEMAFTS